MKPNWRMPAGILIMIALILVVAIIALGLSAYMVQLPVLVQMIAYLVLGIIWILPLRPVMIWMETGRWRAERD